MFKESLVENIKGESDFSQVKHMDQMFFDASSLTDLDNDVRDKRTCLNLA